MNQQSMESIRLFAERSSHSRMLFASSLEYVYIERSHRFCMPRLRFDVNMALQCYALMLLLLRFQSTYSHLLPVALRYGVMAALRYGVTVELPYGITLHVYIHLYKREKEKKFGKSQEFLFFRSCRHRVITFANIPEDSKNISVTFFKSFLNSSDNMSVIIITKYPSKFSQNVLYFKDGVEYLIKLLHFCTFIPLFSPIILLIFSVWRNFPIPPLSLPLITIVGVRENFYQIFETKWNRQNRVLRKRNNVLRYI